MRRRALSRSLWVAIVALTVTTWTARPSSAARRSVEELPDFDESYLGPEGEGQLIELAADSTEHTPHRSGEHEFNHNPPKSIVILVHGIKAAPATLNSIASAISQNDRTCDTQILAFAYDDFHRLASLNAGDLAREITTLSEIANRSPTPFGSLTQLPKPALKIIAHSLGGIISFAALSQLRASPQFLTHWSSVDFLAIDTPWHGFVGPSDENHLFGKWISRKIMPDGLVDLRTASDFLNGTQSKMPKPHLGIYAVGLPSNVRFFPVFASEGKQALNYTEGTLRNVPKILADETLGVRDLKQEHFISVLKSSYRYPEFWAQLQARCQSPRTDPNSKIVDQQTKQALNLLESYFPIYSGDHDSVVETIAAQEHVWPFW